MSKSSTPIRLVIFDWAGTTIDFGSQAPLAAFQSVFAKNGVEVSSDEARAPMGMNKRDHFVAMLNNPSIAERWQERHGRSWTEPDVDRMYEQFIPVQLDEIDKHAELIPGTMPVIAELRDRGIKIGASTGYFSQAAEIVLRSAAESGYVPDANVCADDVVKGRPAPWMIFRLMETLDVFPPASVVKVGDTLADIEAGIAAGCWTIGICDSSSLMGLSNSDYDALPEDQRKSLLDDVSKRFRKAGAHAVIDSIRDLPTAIDARENWKPLN